MTSTSFMTGTGFMKCNPITRLGRLVSAAISVIGNDEVLEARTAFSGAISSEFAEDTGLDVHVLDGSFYREVHVARICQ